jgi:hypothetical protein
LEASRRNTPVAAAEEFPMVSHERPGKIAMKEQPEGSNLSSFLAAILICETIVFAVVFEIWKWPANFCPAGTVEAPAVCLREWLIVIAGWLTFFGGVVAALFVYKTIKPMRQQLSEARRQTSFIVGDNRPFIEIWTHKKREVYRFRIVNWNRRILLISKVEWICAAEYESLPVMIAVDDKGVHQEREMEPDGSLVTWIDMDGFINRSGAPPVMLFHQKASLSTWLNLPQEHPPAQIRVSGFLLGETREPIVLEASIKSLMPENHSSILED